MKKRFNHLFFFLLFSGMFLTSFSQTTYFVDGYHGGIYGHYPLWVTKFIADTLNHHKEWKVNLEIEPESWDTIKKNDPDGYSAIKNLINDASDHVTIEYVNPTYAQSYLYHLSEESIFRQFHYGIKKLKQHFPSIAFTTYSVEEPCFTSALPSILRSLGIKYAVLKNPNTCWGGYVKAYGGEVLNWIGPDGTSILTVPRYASERLQEGSTWQTIAWNNSPAYVNAAIQQGIQLPVGMCLQDAGWKNGRWLGFNKPGTTAYTTWRNYFKLVEIKPNIENWRLSQEDIKVSLVWGSQILQRVSQQVRKAENKILMAEKTASLARLYAGLPYPEKELESAWRTLLLSQHHDCWIVPYNKHQGKTWAEHVNDWTENTIGICDGIIDQSLAAISSSTTTKQEEKIFALNVTAIKRKELIGLQLPGNAPAFTGVKFNGEYIPSQIITNKDRSKTLLFEGVLPAFGHHSYTMVQSAKQPAPTGASISRDKDGNSVMETDLYKLVIDSHHGGSIKQLIAKNLDNKNFIAGEKDGFNTLRGNFFNDSGFITSRHSNTKITILENGPLRIKLQVEGMIAGNTFTQTIQLKQGQKTIDFTLRIAYKKGTGIGENYRQKEGFSSTDRHKAFYNDTCKLLVSFPVDLNNQIIYKDAPLDVTESQLPNTFYNSWDSIKNNMINNWVDVTDGENNYGMAVLTDHVTSYSHGENFPLSLTVQYSGIGLWGRNYTAEGPTDLHYSLLPHKGKWNNAEIPAESIKWNQPLLTSISNRNSNSKVFAEHIDTGISVSSMFFKGNDMYIRLLNNSSHATHHHFAFNCHADEIQFIELNDTISSTLKPGNKQKVNFDCSIPLLGFRTIKLVNVKP